jgi:hypothetical protein
MPAAGLYATLPNSAGRTGGLGWPKIDCAMYSTAPTATSDADPLTASSSSNYGIQFSGADPGFGGLKLIQFLGPS